MIPRRHVYAAFLGAMVGLIGGGIGYVMADEFPYPFKWDTSVSIYVESRIPYGSDVQWVTGDWDSRTDLGMSYCGQDQNCGNVIHYDAYYGDSEPPAWADPHWQSTPCFNEYHQITGDCNTTNHKVDWAVVYYNTYHSEDWDETEEVQYTANHEMAHSFGLAHNNCSTASILHPGIYRFCGQPYYYYLQTHDINDVNNKY